MFGRHHRAHGAPGCGPAERFRHARFEQFSHPMDNGGMRRPKYNVPLNIVNNETNLEVFIYAVGFEKDHVKLSVTGDKLYIKGTRTLDGPEPKFSRQEFPVKNFERVLNLNGQVNVEAISARQENGILIITLPKTQEAQKSVKNITVN